MKAKLFLLTLFTALASACTMQGDHLSLNTIDTNTAFKFEAKYSKDKTDKLEKYLDSALNNELPLNQDIDLIVNLNGKDKFKIKAQPGRLEINMDKRNSSLKGYLKLKKITEGIGKRLTGK